VTDKEAAIHGLALGMVELRELAAPVEEAARGYRSELIGHGWSKSSADQMACEWYVLVMKNMQAAAMGRETDEDSSGDVGK
jgi:hypothetical protein